MMPELPHHIAGWAIAAVAAALVWLTVAGLLFAVMPGRDPFALSESGRTIYVYAGQALLVLLGIHMRLCWPELFTGKLAPYYPLFILVLAFSGIGLAEFFKRRGLRVLSEPLERTGLFLPLLPLVAFWMQPVSAKPGPLPAPVGFQNYAWIWFLAAGLYATVAMIRQSLRFALIAALAANFGLWSLLHYHGLAFMIHPQMWMIPLAVILLFSEQLNRDSLPPAQSQGLRYLALALIYVSSTADMFIAGLGKVWWPPLVLMLLAVGGMMLGILLRVRAYLYLGLAFLFLDIFSMIWHAAVDLRNAWVWWVSGIVLGVLILAMFALFEKRREEMQHLLERLREWD
jgi:hypothetical protein